MLPNPLRQQPHSKRRWKFLISFSGFFFQVRPLYKSSHEKVSHRRRTAYVKKLDAGTKLLFFARKTNRFWRFRFLCRSGLIFHSWWDWGQVYSKTTTTKLLQKEQFFSVSIHFVLIQYKQLDSGEYSKNVT